jgi:DNA-binding CsgD family transcriptional regulator
MLRGREEQQAAIDELLERAREGGSGTLVLRGEPGIGKTALLDYTADRAAGMLVLRTAGIESEAELPFAGLHQLARPALDRLDVLPEPQRLALSGAFGLMAGSVGDRFLAGLGVLSLLSEISPVVCLVDDAHWLDRASAESLLFAARRLHRDGVAMIFAARDYPGAFQTPGIADLTVGGLDAAAAAALLADRDVPLPRELRDQLIADTRGNPLALIELSAAAPQGDGFHLGQSAPRPLTSRVLDAFDHQIRSLPGATRSALLIAAADGTGDLSLLHRAGVGISDLNAAEERGLVSIATGSLEFRHPLIRAAAYHSATHGQRIAAHRALAEACTGYADADRRAWHLAVATTSPDEHVAAELEQAGERAAARNGHAPAAAAFERAAQLSEDPAAAARRLALAAEAAADSGQLDTARSLAERAGRAGRATSDVALTVRLLRVRALADVADGTMLSAHALNIAGAAAIAATEPERALWMLAEAHQAIRQAPHDHDLIAGTVDQLDALGLPEGHELMPLVWLIKWNAAMILGSDTTQLAPLDEVVTRSRALALTVGPRALLIVAACVCLAGRDDAMADIATALVAEARTRGVIGILPGGLSQVSWAETMLGRYTDARISATECRQLARDLGQPFWADWACGTLAYLAAVEGDEQRCREYAAELVPAAESVAETAWAEAGLVLLDLGYGRVADAFERLEAVASGPARHHPNVTRMAPDLVEAAIRLGRPDRAAEALARFRQWAPLVGQPWATALLARCEALAAADAEPHYQRALALHERDTRPFDRARTELVYGEWLRRERRKREARIHLHAALQAFEALGATPWADRARAELRATGILAPRAAAPDILAALTPQELQITRLAARGLQNRDIAAQLFLSPRTVAYHLYKAYPKLGVSSRAELPAFVPAG